MPRTSTRKTRSVRSRKNGLPSAKSGPSRTQASTRPLEWEVLGSRRLKRLIGAARAIPGLDRLGPNSADWHIDLSFVSSPRMRELNRTHLGKDYATDVLSFPAPEAFRQSGLLGELVICMPVMKSQARERGHQPGVELEVLLAHGLLHLLGLDHEKGPKQLAEMARWEQRLLEEAGSRAHAGLIERAHSGI